MIISESSFGRSAARLSADVRISNLWTWNLDRVSARLRERFGWSGGFAAQVELEYRRFMALESSANGKSLGMRGPVDDFWHEHILFTRDYAEFCLAVSGKFIHHEPAEPQGGRGIDSYGLTLTLLERKFGPVARNVWPSLGAADCGTDACAMCDKIEAYSQAH
jgi:hypothetical protein